MKEFIDKLISRLEEEINKIDYIRDIKIAKWLSTNYEDAKCDGFEKAIEIVTELAEEYKGGWIPCSEKQPNKDGYFLITTSDGEVDVREYDYGNGLGWDGFERIIAWQPIAPYTEGE